MREWLLVGLLGLGCATGVDSADAESAVGESGAGESSAGEAGVDEPAADRDAGTEPAASDALWCVSVGTGYYCDRSRAYCAAFARDHAPGAACTRSVAVCPGG